MNDFILRGFCKKCEQPCFEGEKIKSHIGKYDSMESCEPVWFLSATQMEILNKWYNINMNSPKVVAKFECYVDSTLRIQFPYLLKDNPFLVAKILKENDKK